MNRRPSPLARPRRALVATVATTALAGTVFGAPAGAQEAESTETGAAPEPPPPETPPSLPVAPPASPPAEVPVAIPVPALVPVRTGKAIDVPAVPATELPPASPPAPADDPSPASPPALPAPDTPRPARERPTRRRPASDPPRATEGPRASSTSIPAAAAPPTPSQHTVVAGDHLWSIATARVAAATGRVPADVAAVEVAGYWTQLCMLNEARLRSGDVNLVYPGEVLDLPAR